MGSHDLVGGLLDDLLGSFSFSGIWGTLQLLFLVLIAGLVAFLGIWFFYKWNKYRINVIIKIKRQGNRVTGYDKMGIFKDKSGIYYGKLWKRKLKVELPDFQHMIREKGFGDVIFLTQEGINSVYQLTIPDYPKNLGVIDHNIMRLGSLQLREDRQIYSTEKSFVEQYGIHIAYAVLVVIIGIAMWLVLRKAEAIILIGGQQIELGRQYLDAAINIARPAT